MPDLTAGSVDMPYAEPGDLRVVRAVRPEGRRPARRIITAP